MSDLSKQWTQIYSIFVVCLNTVTTGQFISWTSPYIPVLKEQGVSMEVLSYLTITPSITLIIASPFVGTLPNWFGRRAVMLGIAVSYSISLVLIYIGAHYFASIKSTNTTLYFYFAARVFNGFGYAGTIAIVPCYIAEIATPQVRGIWGNCIPLSVFLGEIIMNMMGAYLPIASSAYFSLLLPLAFMLNVFFLRESPYYLLMKRRVDEARAALQWLRRSSCVEEDLMQLTFDVQRQLSERGRYMDLINNPSNRKACIIVILVRVMQHFSGNDAFLHYSQTIFIESGSSLSPSMSAVVYSTIMFICSLVNMCILDRLGRRQAMIISCIGCSIVLFAQAAFYYAQKENSAYVKGLKLLKSVFPLISMLAFVAFYTVGLALIPTLLLSELFSIKVKSKALAVTIIFFGITNAISTKIFAVFLGFEGLYAAFLFHALFVGCSSVVSYFIVPETKGKTLEEIQQDFKR